MSVLKGWHMPVFLFIMGPMKKPMWRITRADVVCVAGLGALAVAFWGNCIFGDRVPVAGVYQKHFAPYNAAGEETLTRQWDSLLWDSVAQFYPWRELAHRSFSEDGEFPLWNPHQFCGTPFVGNGQSGLYYPPHWILKWVSTGTGMGVLNALHYFLAALFTFLLLQVLGARTGPSALGAVTYALGGFMVTWTELPSLIETATWMPAGLLGVELIFRRRPVLGGIVLAVALGASLLAGHFQIAAYVWLMAAGSGLAHLVYWLVVQRKAETGERGLLPVAALAAAFVLGLGLGAVQLLPTLELGGMSPRGSGTVSEAGYRFHQARAMLPVELMTIVDPDFIGSPVTMNYPKVRISYSEHCGFIGVVAGVCVVLGLILGYRRKVMWLFVAFGGLALWAAAGGWPAYIYYFYIPKVGLAGGFARLLSVFTLCAAVVAGLGCQALEQRVRKRDDVQRRAYVQIVGWALVGLALMQALPWAYRINPRSATAEVYPRTALVEKICELAENSRVLAITEPEKWTLFDLPEAMLPPNSATVYGYYSVIGYDSLFTSTYREFANEMQHGIASPAANGNMVLISRLAADAAGCGYYVSAEPLLADDELNRSKRFGLVASGPDGYVYHTGLAWPYAGTRVPPAGQVARLFSWQPADAHRSTANRIYVLLCPDQAGPLRIAEGYYPGWIAYVGGRLQRPRLVDTTFMEVDVPGICQSVELVYYPASVVVGGFFGLIALMLLVAIAAGAKMVRETIEESRVT